MQSALGVFSFEFLKALKFNVSSELSRAFNLEDGLFSKDDVFADIEHWVELDGSLGAKRSAHFLLDFFGAVVDEDAGLRLAF